MATQVNMPQLGESIVEGTVRTGGRPASPVIAITPDIA